MARTKKASVTGDAANKATKSSKERVVKPTPEEQKLADEKTAKPASKPQEPKGLTYAEAEKVMNAGGLIKLPEWEGFWFKNLNTDKVYVFTKEGEILDTPHEKYKESNYWQEYTPNEDQFKKLSEFQDSLNNPQDPIQTEEPAKTEEPSDSFEKAYEALQKGKKVTLKKLDGYLQMDGDVCKQYAKNGDYLGNITLADYQTETDWKVK